MSADNLQTRFSFYDAPDYESAEAKDLAQQLQQQQQLAHQNQRFRFYTAAPTLDTPDFVVAGAAASSSPQQQERRASPDSRISPESQERQRMDAQSDLSNPYEDAIREALELLRKHRTTSANDETDDEAHSLLLSPRNYGNNCNATSSDAAIEIDHLTPLGEAYQAEMEERRKQRQERMTKYANRLAELKQQDVPSETSLLEGPESNVQAGVERVLLAILERAGSRGRQTQEEEVMEQQTLSARSLKERSSWSRGEEKKTVMEDENALLQAMSDLLGGGSVMSAPLQPSQSFDPVTAARSTDSVEECDTKEKDDDGDDNDDDDNEQSSAEATPRAIARTMMIETTHDALSEAVETVVSTENNTPDELDELVRQFSSTTAVSAVSPKHILKHPIEERVRRILSSDNSDLHMTETQPAGLEEESGEDEEDDDDDYSSSQSEESELDDSSCDEECDEEDPLETSIERVLGPLAKSNATTGVVLEPDSPTSTSGVLVNTISAVMSLVTGDVNLSPTSRSEETKDRYTDVDDDDDEDSDDDDDDDDTSHSESSSDGSSFSDATDLMRSLCAHILPVGVGQPCRVLNLLPEWDESNPDEPGYRIVRLRSSQLRRIEEEFQLMVDKLKRHSERDLSALGAHSGSDAMFERDLKAAEDLLDREEQRILTVTSKAPPQLNGSIDKCTLAAPKRLTVNTDLDLECDSDQEEPPLSAFPGIKNAGKGDLGELEYFHLPIIFKSHVTGFEPTKDLHLEQGNIIAGQYLVEGELGSAAFSTTYRCIDLSSDGDGPDGHEQVCLKVIKNTKDFFDQSLDEIKILELLRQTGMCNEKSIVEMKTFFYYREHLIIVTELLRQNLFEFGKFIIDHNEEPYFTLPRLAYITRQCLVALEYVHSLGLVHSDVKPENILLGSYSRATIKIIDFGSSCYLTDRQSSYIQSRSYRAPEVVLGLPYDGRIDIWSLGCVVAEMYSGEVTFQNDSIVSMLSRIEAICGPFPRHMIAQGRQSGRFFTKCGLLFERVASVDDESSRSDSDESRTKNFDIFQPKITTLAARLGFDSTLMDDFDNGKALSTERRHQAIFVDFVRKVLTLEPESRPTASDALNHPWMQYAYALSEEDVKYPTT